MGESRIKKSATNMISGVAFRVISTLTAFIVRTVFISCLNEEYLSVNGLYSSILSMLSLAELGFSTAMVYSMYKPLAESDYKKLAQIMHLYRRVYAVIGTVILVIGLALVPFLDTLIKDKPDIPGLTFYYLLFLLDSVLSYWFFAYRTSILQADQKSYIITNYNSIFNLVRSVLEILSLLLFRNFTVYLLMRICVTILQNICLAVKAKKEYPIFDKNNKEELSKSEKKSIFNDVKALMIQKISFRVLNSSASIIISAFVGVIWVGRISNYILIIDAVVAVLSQITGAITASMGNFFAKENRESGYDLFKRIDFMNFWIYGFSSIAFLVLLNPFVELWLGEMNSSLVVSQSIVVALVLRFFVEGYINMMSAFRSTLGLFTQGKYLPLLVAVLNIVFSIALSFPFGAAGVILATPIARCCVNGWYMPLVIHRDGFKKSVKPFYKSYILRIILLAVSAFGMYALSKYLIFDNGVNVFSFVIMIALVTIIPNVLFLLVFCKTKEFNYFLSLAKNLLKNLKKR